MSKRVTGYLNWQRHRKKFHHRAILDIIMANIAEKEPDHLAITGDLVNLATDPEIEQATRWLKEHCPPETTSLVPGNHDAYVRGAFEKAVRAWSPWLPGGSGGQFPFLKISDPVAIIGFSTSNATLPFRATGRFTKFQAAAGEKLLYETKMRNLFRVVLIHHPPYPGATSFMKHMQGMNLFKSMIESSGAELVLHGHTHLNTRYDMRAGDYNVPIIGISSASQDHGDKKPVAGFNLFDIERRENDWSCQHQRYTLSKSGGKAAIIEQQTIY